MIRRITKALILALGVIAAIVATGLAMGWPMWGWIVAYWITLTAKNLIDWIAAGKGTDDERH